MSKRKRDYDKEVEDAVKRMAEHPEYLEASESNKAFLDFLDGIGVNPDTYASEAGKNFWGQVRDEINTLRIEKKEEEKRVTYTKSQLAEVNVCLLYTSPSPRDRS